MDVTGWFYNPDGTFSMTKRKDSEGVVILQTPKERVIAGLKAVRVIDWYNAKEHVYETFNKRGGFPTEIELILINKNENIDKCDVDIILGDERCSYTVWDICTDTGAVSYESKSGYDYYCTLGFVPILRIKL